MNKLGIIGIAAGAVCGLAYAVKKSIGKQKLHPCCFEMEQIGEDARKEYLSSHPGAVIDENAEKEIGEIFKRKYKEADNQYGKKFKMR